jgi:Asp-tRNA(Asn)/Glu-tRNA(Gln) amidotransferase A subunit family amidase
MKTESHASRSPRLAGALLRTFTVIAERPLLGAPLRRMMLKASDIPRFRDTQANYPAIVVPPLPRAHQFDSPSFPPCTEAPPAMEPGTAAAFAQAYRDGTMTPMEVCEAFFRSQDSAESAMPRLAAYIAIDRGDVRAQAQASTERFASGSPLGLLDGVPVAVKDEIDQVPYPTTAGTRFLGRVPAVSDATVVTRLRAAGALLVGKTNMHEAGLGVSGINPHHGTARNPHNPARMTGGSSSGSCAAVAAGLCPIALAADAGGSIRIPASFCGVVGLKPTFGRVSEHGATALCFSLAHLGPVAATARDAALAFAVIAGPDVNDPNTAGQPPVLPFDPAGLDIRGLRIGIDRAWFQESDPSVAAACDDLLQRMRELGVCLVDIRIPDLDLIRPVHQVTAACEWAAAFDRQYQVDRRAFGLDVRLTLLLARSLRPTDYVHAQRLRRRVCDRFAGVLEQVDVIATPTTPCTAPLIPPDALRHGESNLGLMSRLAQYVIAANVTGLPAISIPAGYDADAMPIGLQLIARPWREDLLLSLAGAAEQIVPRRTPRVHHPLWNMDQYGPSLEVPDEIPSQV